MEYTALGERRVANIAQDKAGCYIVTTLSPSAVYSIQTKQQCFKQFIVFYLLNKQFIKIFQSTHL